PNVDALTKGGPECTIEALADQIVRNVREVQAEGPYLLGGFCLRSLLAYEIAQRLQQDGEEVALLVLGDLYAPGRKPQWTRAQRIIRRIHRESCNLSDVLRSSVAQWLPELSRLAASWFRLITDRSDDPGVPCELLQALYVAELRYDLAPFSGKVVFLESGESSLLQPTTSGSWKGLIDNVEVLSYPGIHENLFSESQLRVFAGKIGHSIDRAFGQDDHRNSRHDNQLHKTLVPLRGGFSR
ncbi:MAG: thioesterase domain-containing protein, partial [Acidobacteriota bacterium]|nr:thioesterase domain-containing protein [Acidobacteriota bacterium]